MRPEDTEVWDPIPKIVKPGEGSTPPDDAIVLFGGQDMSGWDIPENVHWVVRDGIVTISPSLERQKTPVWIFTKERFGDVQLHVEWRAPAHIEGEGQRRGNSGIFLPGRYEIQVLDSYQNPTYINGQCASVYKQQPPLVNACRKPGEWQTYDIIFKVPRFSRGGRLRSAGRVTVIHNGVLVQDHVKIEGRTTFIGHPEYVAHPPRQPIGLQDHGNAVSFRNIWLRTL